MKTGAVIGWSGFGDLEDLRRTVVSKLGAPERDVVLGPSNLSVRHLDPVRVATRVRHLPGVSWVAVGFGYRDPGGRSTALERLAQRYLRPGSSFSVAASISQSDEEEGDVLLDSTSTLLKSVNGSKVDDARADVIFRITQVGRSGVVGVQIAEGQGGRPTSGSLKLACLVSGGYHSAVTAWLAVLQGYSVRLVHSRTGDDESLRQVARLYAELSRRADASTLSLELLSGEGEAGERLASWLNRRGKNEMVVAGVHPECRDERARTTFAGHPRVSTPLILTQEDDVRAQYESLGLRLKASDSSASLRLRDTGIRGSSRSFGGKEADISGVLDSLLSA